MTGPDLILELSAHATRARRIAYFFIFLSLGQSALIVLLSILVWNSA